MGVQLANNAEGNLVDYTPAGAVTGGQPIQIGDLTGFPNQDIAAGVKGALQIKGEAKGVATSDTGSVGDDVFWDANADPVGGTAGTGALTTVASDGDWWVGTLREAKAATDKYVIFGLNEPNPKAANSELLAVNDSKGTLLVNTTTETILASVTIAGDRLVVGDTFRVKTTAFVVDQNGSDTLQFQLYFGTEVVWDSTAVTHADNDIANLEVDITINTLGSSGKIIASGVGVFGVPGTAVPTPFVLPAATEDISGDIPLKLTGLFSAAHADNECELTRWIVEKLRGRNVGQI